MTKKDTNKENNDLIEIKIKIAKSGEREIECGGLSLVDVLTVLTGCHKYLMAELKKELSIGTEEGTADEASGSGT